MSWFRVDDGSAFHVKVVKAGNDGWGAVCRAGAWSSAHGTDGFVPDEIAKLIAPAKVWKKATTAGLVETCDGGLRIHDYLEWNLSAAEVEKSRAELSEKRRKAGLAGNAKRWSKPRKDIANASQVRDGCDGKSDDVCDGHEIANASPNPIPPHPLTDDPSDRCDGDAPDDDESFGLEPEEPQKTKTKPKRQPKAKQQGLPEPVPDFGEVMGLWRDRYRTSAANPAYGRYTESGADVAAVKALIADAVAVVEDEVRTRKHEPVNGRKAAVLHVLDHWMRAFLADQKSKFIEEKHPLSWLRNGRTKYGDPWSGRHHRKPTPEEIAAAKTDPFGEDPRAAFEAARVDAANATRCA